MVENQWREVWGSKAPAVSETSLGELSLADLIAADGFNTGFGDITVEAWTDFVVRTCKVFSISEGDSLFEVGCGSGAFLYLPYQDGVHVGGIDFSKSLLDVAKATMPDGEFVVRDAAQLDVNAPVDVALAFSVFLYFSGLDYAREVIERMYAKATRGVAILDIPDASTADEALSLRQEQMGGPDAYAKRYAGLPHQSYERNWVAQALTECGASSVKIESQSISGYGNGRFRFNAYALLD